MIRRRKRLVRLHLAGGEPSVEGVFHGFWAGHYVLRLATVLVEVGSTEELDGPDIRVPRDRVVLMQVLR